MIYTCNHALHKRRVNIYRKPWLESAVYLYTGNHVPVMNVYPYTSSRIPMNAFFIPVLNRNDWKNTLIRKVIPGDRMRPYSIRISGLSLTVMRYRKTELWKSSGAPDTRLAETALNNTLLCIFTAKLDMHSDQAKIWRSRHNQESLTITAVRLKTVRFVLKYKEPSQSIYGFLKYTKKMQLSLKSFIFPSKVARKLVTSL